MTVGFYVVLALAVGWTVVRYLAAALQNVNLYSRPPSFVQLR
jgi:hypothetical protein